MRDLNGRLDEVRQLADAMFDGTISARQVRRLNDLVVSDAACLQAYVEQIDFHGAMLDEADEQPDELAAINVLREFAHACEMREQRDRRRQAVLSTASVVLVVVLVGWFVAVQALKPTPLGSIANLSADAVISSGRGDLGSVLRQGDVLSIAEGVVSVQLPHAMVDLTGPARIQLNDFKDVELGQGTLTARVLPGGEGFRVRTPDAEVLDQGTEFLVHYDSRNGTEVSVRRGRVTASLLDRQGLPTKILELTAQRAARFHLSQSLFAETDYQPARFEMIDRSRGAIRSIDGMLRTTTSSPKSLRSEETTTPNHMLVIPERQAVVLERDLTVETLTGQTRIPAGSVVSSYLVHYDPTALAAYAPRGSITFFGRIAAALVHTDALNATDSLFGLEETAYETRSFRGLELDEDEIRISDDRRTVSFFFGMAPRSTWTRPGFSL